MWVPGEKIGAVLKNDRWPVITEFAGRVPLRMSLVASFGVK
jgi:hypothetical protein